MAYYSILYASIRPSISEKLSVGIILVSGNKTFVRVSQNKVNLLKHIFPHGAYNSLRHSLKSIEFHSKSNEDKFKISNELDVSNFEISKEFTFSYLEYLSKYNSNILTFSKPVTIDLEVELEVFNMLYNKYIDEFIDKKPKVKSFEVLKNKFISEVKDYFNTERKLTSNEYPNLIAPIKFDLIGKNEIEVFTQFIDSEKPTHLASNEINTMYSIKDVVPKSKRYIVSSEPEKKRFPEQHRLWSNLRKTNVFEYVDQSEVEKIKTYAKSHGVKPLLREEES